MNRGEIKTHIRTLADELTEAPEGMFQDTDLDTLINIAQINVEIDLIEYIPYYFRKPKVFSITANKREYSIVTDIGISDFLLFETILHNKVGEIATPLPFVEPDDIWQYAAVGDIGPDPKCWGYEDKDNIFIEPTPSGSVSNRLKSFYFKRIPNLNHDSEDSGENIATPHLPEPAHELVAVEVVKLWHLADEEEAQDIEKKYNKMLWGITYRLSSAQGLTVTRRPGIREYLQRSKFNIYD